MIVDAQGNPLTVTSAPSPGPVNLVGEWEGITMEVKLIEPWNGYDTDTEMTVRPNQGRWLLRTERAIEIEDNNNAEDETQHTEN